MFPRGFVPLRPFARVHKRLCHSNSSSHRNLSTLRVDQAESVGQAPFAVKQARVCIVGSGRMGAIRAHNFYSSPSFHLQTIVDEVQERRQAMQSKYGITSYRTLNDAIKHEDFDAVWIAAPTMAHKELILLAASHGLDVGVEKPVAGNEEDIAECYKACQDNNVHLMCSFQRRFDPNYRKVADIVHSGALGEIRSIHAVFRDFPVPPLEFLLKGGCLFHDLAVHDIDFVRYLTSQEPCEVTACSSSFLPALKEAGVADQGHALFRFPSGLVFTIELSRSSPFGYDQRMEVCGSAGILQVGNVPATSVVHSKGLSVAGDSPIGSFPERYNAAYQIEIDSFGNTLFSGRSPLVTCADSIRATRVAEAARQAALTGLSVKIE